jgi:hypothetical protein
LKRNGDTREVDVDVGKEVIGFWVSEEDNEVAEWG